VSFEGARGNGAPGWDTAHGCAYAHLRAVAAQAAVVADKARASAHAAAARDGVVAVVAVLTAARRAPRVHIESLAPRQPPHAALLRPGRHKLKAAAGARGARWRLRIGLAHSLVGAKCVAAEAARVASHARAVSPILLRSPHNVHTTRDSSLGATALGLHHSLGPRRHAIARSGLLDLPESRGLARRRRKRRAREPRVHGARGGALSWRGSDFTPLPCFVGVSK